MAMEYGKLAQSTNAIDATDALGQRTDECTARMFKLAGELEARCNTLFGFEAQPKDDTSVKPISSSLRDKLTDLERAIENMASVVRRFS